MSLVGLYDMDAGALVSTRLDIERNAELFGQWSLREDYPGSPHKDTQAIYLRMPPGVFDMEDPEKIRDVFHNSLEAEDTEAYARFQTVRSQVMRLMSAVAGERLGRVVIARLAPGGAIDSHSDEGDMPLHYDRFHIVVDAEDVMFQCGDKVEYMKPGQVWWIDNKQVHSVVNRGVEPRTHIIVDIKLLS